ncbi:hypothetical protein GOQ30_09840 [Flavobacterium sp. TP390]|uniref:HNH domain-containing protein n=1 Tax=Flavobacterium profundi TaxID=1774945 RepID=A0A6I4IIK0_9FLAO|nr:HNH endonuclease [Flavobacterium profundi]MVO09458.1 hypothetical protein [Flavobacterium profundi]
MRKILIDDSLKLKAKLYSNNLFKSKGTSFITPISSLEKLRDELGIRKHKNERLYVQKIIDKYDTILRATPSEIEVLIKEFNLICNSGILNKKIKPNDKLKLNEKIVKAMRYDEVRNSEFHHIVNATGIKTCVYCNSQLTVVTSFSFYDKKEKKRKKKIMAKFELDHYYPKSKYPFLSTSFFNLYPVCGNCNRAKHDNPIAFELYSSNPNDLEVFNFWIDDKSILDYWLDPVKNHSNLKIGLECINGDYDYLNNYNSMFGIQGIYDTQTDLAEELVHKAKVYSNSYKKSLVENFKDLFPDKMILNRIIIGNYAESSEIHKRPMAKYTQDIARQLGLIK